jgi:predicted ATPase/DNA-binding CsgD family transcriptional regulator
MASTILVGGEAGIGKTRLVEEFAHQARSTGALVGSGRCVPVGPGGLFYGPVVGILRDLVRQAPDAPVAAVLDRLTAGPEVDAAPSQRNKSSASYAGIGHTGNVVEELAKTRLFDAVLECILALAERSPVVLVFEDLHWADSASTELLNFLARNLAQGRVLLVATYRSDEIGRDHRLRPWLSELTRHPRVASMRLEGLRRDDMAAMLGGILGHDPEWTLLDAVWARSQGNPFFAEELTAARAQPSLSAEFQTVMLARVERCSKDAQRLLRAAAAVGASVDHELLVGLNVLGGESIEEALDEVIDDQIIVLQTDGSDYRFRHDLLREAVYASTLPAERRRLHRCIAATLAATESRPFDPGRRAAELAAHWWAAGAWREALDASVVAGDAATDVWAFPEAHAHFERALAAEEHLPAGSVSAADRLALMEKASDAAYFSGEVLRSVELARAAIDGMDATIDPTTAARRYVLLGRNIWAVGGSDAAFEAYHCAAALVPTSPPSAELARILAEEARGLMLLARLRDAASRCNEALTIARAAGARAEEGHILCTLGVCIGETEDTDRGLALLREALAIAKELGNPDDLNRAYANLSHVLNECGRLEEGAALVHESFAWSEAICGARLTSCAMNSLDALVSLGRYDDAERLLAEIDGREVGVCTPHPSMARAQLALCRGRLDEAAEHVERTDELTAPFADVQFRGAYHLLAAELAILRDRPDEAYDELEQALALAANTDDASLRPAMYALATRSLADGVEAAKAHGRRRDVDKARLLAVGFEQEAVALAAGRNGRAACPPRVWALAATCAAERSRLSGSDPDLWAEAKRRWELAREPLPAISAGWRLAEALLEGRADRARAAETLQDAWRASVELGAEALQQQIEQLAQRARIQLRDVDRSMTPASESTLASDLGLTPREVEVLQQLARGRTDREIAGLLFISRKTASVHVSNVLRKLEVTNRVEAGRIGQAHGLD